MKSTPHRRRRRATGTAGLALASAALAVLSAAGCSSSGSSAPPASGTTAAGTTAAGSSSAAASGQKVTLTFWTWVPNIDKVVALWNQAHPDIQVNVQVQ